MVCKSNKTILCNQSVCSSGMNLLCVPYSLKPVSYILTPLKIDPAGQYVAVIF